MLEPWRSRYLHALGVDVYLPRHPLPAAAPAVAIAWDDAVAIEPEPPVDPVEIAPEPPVAARRPAAAATLIDVEPAVAPPARTAPAASGPAVAPSLRIKLMIAASDSGVLIVDDALGNARHDGQRLLGNLLFALQRKPVALKIEPFDWPLPTLRNRAIGLDEAAARETLAAFLNRKINGDVRAVVLLGATAQRWVDAPMRQALAAERTLRWSTSLSTAAVLGDPARKSQWWRDLRDLAAAH